MVNTANSDIKMPGSIKKAMSRKNCKRYRKVTNKEPDSLIRNQTWGLADLPNENIERYKARLIAKECSQQYDVDYQETFSPVVRYATIRMLFALASEKELHMHQLDVLKPYLINSKYPYYN